MFDVAATLTSLWLSFVLELGRACPESLNSDWRDMAVESLGFHDAIGRLGQVGNVRDLPAGENTPNLRGHQSQKVSPEECCWVAVEGLETTKESRGLHVAKACD